MKLASEIASVLKQKYLRQNPKVKNHDHARNRTGDLFGVNEM
jgi:hypothetical protein